MTTLDSLTEIRAFYRESRAIQKIKDFPAVSAASASLGQRMTEWAEQVSGGPEPPPGFGLDVGMVHAAACVILACKEEGMDPGWEVMVFPPEQTEFPCQGSWRVAWESGPDGWAIGSSLGSGLVVPERFARGQGWFTECYYAFDLVFRPGV